MIILLPAQYAALSVVYWPQLAVCAKLDSTALSPLHQRLRFTLDPVRQYPAQLIVSVPVWLQRVYAMQDIRDR